MKGFWFALVCVLTIMATAACFAQERRVGLGVSGGVGLLRGADDDEEAGFAERAELGPMMNFILKKSVTDHLALGLNVGYGYNYDKDSKAYRTNLIPIDLKLIYNVSPDATANPYLAAGAGIVSWDSNHRPTDVQLEKQRDPAFLAGAGLDVFLNDYMALDFNGMFRYMLTDDKDMIGRTRDLGIASNDRHLWYFGVGLTWYPGKPKDSDGDGVPDRKDKCPDTPMGAFVDEFGCPKDSDGDGVYDGLDKCPDTPKGATVDARGCPKDSDMDGVYDGLDKCPDTPKDVEVDEHGCPKLPDLSELEGILFRFDKSDVIPSPNPILDRAVELLSAYPSVKVEIHGHTCNMGSEAYNMKLGMRRAEAVKKYLVDHGINAEMLIPKSFGETSPIAPNDTKEGRQKNRRIQFKIAE